MPTTRTLLVGSPEYSGFFQLLVNSVVAQPERSDSRVDKQIRHHFITGLLRWQRSRNSNGTFYSGGNEKLVATASPSAECRRPLWSGSSYSRSMFRHNR